MAYTAWSVVYGEQPTAAKWNQLGANDAGFKDGTNIDNNAIITRHLGSAANLQIPIGNVDIAGLTLGAITKITTNQGGITSEVDLTGSSLPIVVPSGRKVRFFWSIPLLSATVSGDRVAVTLKEGSTIYVIWSQVRNYGLGSILSGETVVSGLSAGNHTFKLTIQREIGTGSIATNADANHPIEFYAELR